MREVYLGFSAMPNSVQSLIFLVHLSARHFACIALLNLSQQIYEKGNIKKDIKTELNKASLPK